MNTKKKPVLIVLVMASITAVIISAIGLVTPTENGYSSSRITRKLIVMLPFVQRILEIPFIFNHWTNVS